MQIAQTSRVPHVLFFVYVLFFLLLSVNPYDRTTWFFENLAVLLVVIVLAFLYVRHVRFSPTAYLLMSIFLFLHTIGGHYTFANVPFDWVTNFFAFDRNHYDRIVHFSVGFYAFAIAEWLYVKRLVRNGFLLATYPLFAIMAIALLYEIVEWVYVVMSDPLDGATFLGSQGDMWDAQKDMLSDTLGAVVALGFFFWMYGVRRIYVAISTHSYEP